MKLFWLEIEFNTDKSKYLYKVVVMAENALEVIPKFESCVKLPAIYECTRVKIRPILSGVRIV
ncbi:hypothetical protein LCGC14_2138840 [marine sediment metagenome]|uniref:Uncharacterized protein n=1 Tax=marine sediment metagenome TaxID=412755 RepID=A0A0F9DYY6_9ZZZZ